MFDQAMDHVLNHIREKGPITVGALRSAMPGEVARVQRRAGSIPVVSGGS